MKTNGRFKVSAKEGLIFMMYNPGTLSISQYLLYCEVEVSVSRDRVVALRTISPQQTCGFGADFFIIDTASKRILSQTKCGSAVPKTFSVSSSLTIQVNLGSMVVGRDHRVAFRFKEVAVSEKPGMTLQYVTTTSGKTLSYPP